MSKPTHPGHDSPRRPDAPSTSGAAGPVADASVRIATRADADAIGLVQSDLWRELYAGTLAEEVLAQFQPAPFAAAWAASLTSPPSRAYRVLVAFRGLDLVGFGAIGPSPDADATDLDAEVLVFGVAARSRRQGHGSRLLNAVADTARGSGFGRLRVWTPSVSDELVAFLQRAGFEPDGARRDRVIGPPETNVQHELRLVATISE